MDTLICCKCSKSVLSTASTACPVRMNPVLWIGHT